MPSERYTLIALSALLAMLLAVIVYALLRFGAAARATKQSAHAAAHDYSLNSVMQEAVLRLRDQGREMQARAEASERLSDQIVSSMTSGLLLVDVDGIVHLVNPSGRRLLKLDGAEGRHYREVLAGVGPLRDVIDEGLREGRPIMRRTIRFERENGHATRLGLTVSPVHGPEGQLQSVIGLFNDLTAVLELEEQLRFKDSLARLGELTAGIAHEFRNGLATIHGYARLMDSAQLPANHTPYLEGIRAETDVLRNVVTNFLNFARPVPLSLSPLDLGTLVSRAADEVRHDVEGRGGRIDVQGTFAEVEGDEVLLRQAFSNLCRNAAEACSTVPRPPLIAVVGTTQPDRMCRVVIRDNGPGVDPAAMDRIFQPFFTTRSNGTGLGLALVQKIIVTHNGRVTASNLEDGGASFDVVLPVHQSPRAV